MATKTKKPLSEDVTLNVTFRSDGGVFIALDEVVWRAGTAREIIDRSSLAVEEVDDHLGFTDLQAVVAFIDAERSRRAEHDRRWWEYVRYREEKKQAAREARLEAARKAREQEQEQNRRRWKKLDEELQQKAEREAATKAAALADLEGQPAPFDAWKRQAS